jgi:hypothetical protein
LLSFFFLDKKEAKNQGYVWLCGWKREPIHAAGFEGCME